MSNEWERRIKGSQAGLEAFEVANVYDTIANTLNAAHKKSKEVLENYEKAKETLEKFTPQFNDLVKRNDEYTTKLNQLEADQDESEKKLSELGKKHMQLEQLLNALTKDVERIENWVAKTQQNENTLNEIKRDLDAQTRELEQSDEKAKELKRKIQSVDSMKSKLPTDGSNVTVSRVKEMNETIDKIMELNTGINDRVAKIMNNNKNLGDKLDEVNEIISDLKLLIETTRNIANQINNAVKFKNASYIKLRNAPVFSPSITNIGSLYLKTTESHAPISVLYNQANPSTYLALYLQDGKPRLQYRLSEKSPANIVSSNKAINDNNWYRLEVERVGLLARLKVYFENETLLDEQTSSSNDNSVIFNVDSMNANFYLGKFKFPGDRVPVELREPLTHDGVFKNNFEGAIDTVNMNRHSFGLWNYDEANDIGGEIKRASVPGQTFKSPVHFTDKKSFLCSNRSIANPNRKLRKFDIILKFKTANPNGLLWYTRDDKVEVSILLENGQIVTEVKSAREAVVLNSENAQYWNDNYKLNDNKFHVIQVNFNFDAARQTNITVMEKEKSDSVTGDELLATMSQSFDTRNIGPTQVCVGGIPSSYKDIRDQSPQFSGFVGCFEYYYSRIFDNNRIYLEEELVKSITTASGVDNECPDTIDQCSFSRSSQPVYVSFSALSVEDDASFGISFVPEFSNGTLLFIRQRGIQDGEAINFIYLYMENLKIHLVVKNTNVSVKLESDGTVNYNELNHVYVVKNDKGVVLNTNDAIKSSPVTDKERIPTNSDLFVGGVPEPERVGMVDNSAKFHNFQGCVVDVVYKDKPLKFQNAKDRSSKGLDFSKCHSSRFQSIPSLSSDSRPVLRKYSDVKTKLVAKDEPCTLSKSYDQSLTKPVGIRFGLTKNSRIEVLDDHMDKYNTFISLKFRTILSEGLIFYATDAPFEKYIAVWLQDGYLNYAFDSGTSPIHIISKKQYNDGRYHTLIATRNKQEGTLKILDRSNTTLFELLQDKAAGDDESLAVIGPYYIGGVSEDVLVKIPETQKSFINVEPYVGCMSEFLIGYKPLKNRVKRIDIMNCSNNHESGVFFTGKNQGSHASLISHISMKDAFELEMDVKARTKNGLILYIGPKEAVNKDYATLELINGELHYQIYYGGMNYSVKYIPKESNNELCNSNWLRIKLKKGSNGKIVLTVKNEEFGSNHADLIPSSAKFNTLYLGGLPNFNLYSKVSTTKEPFVGCIRDLLISQGAVKTRKILLDLELEEDVLNYCPLK